MARIVATTLSGVRFAPVNNVAGQPGAEEMFFGQLEDFCRLVQQEFLARFNEITTISTSSAHALGFAEMLMLCPTQEAARVCIRRELPAALSFVVAIQALQQQLRQGNFKLPTKAPEYQTRFFLLASTVQDFLQTARQQLAPVEPM